MGVGFSNHVTSVIRSVCSVLVNDFWALWHRIRLTHGKYVPGGKRFGESPESNLCLRRRANGIGEPWGRDLRYEGVAMIAAAYFRDVDQ